MMKTDSLVDIGVNLTNSRFTSDCRQVLERAMAAGVGKCIVTGTSLNSSIAAIELCQHYRSAFPGMLYATAGIHPHEASTLTEESLGQLGELARTNPGIVVAIGETGLDFNRNFSTPEAQIRAFEKQLQLACEIQLPLFLHERDAHATQIDILRSFGKDLPPAVIHCFTGNGECLRHYLELGFYIGITGWICDERRGVELQQLVREVPLNRLLVETDSPYLLPRSLRPKPGNNRNEPAFLTEIVATIARCREQPAAELAAATTANAGRLFRLEG